MLELQLDEAKWAHTTLRTVFLVLVIKEVFFFIQSKQLSKSVVVGKCSFIF